MFTPILAVREVGDPVLRQPAAELSASEIRERHIQDLIAMMRETMRRAPGVGLAAPQVGVPLRLVVIEDKEEYHRPTRVRVEALNEFGQRSPRATKKPCFT